MEAERIRKYERVGRFLEEPIREIVPPIWHLPFVIDTGYTCSGHIIVKRQFGLKDEDYPPDKSYIWRPQEPRLEFAFSVDPALAQARDSFRRDLSKVAVASSGVCFSFDKIRTHQSNYLPYAPWIPCVNLDESYRASVSVLDKTESSVILIEMLLRLFWEEVAKVVCIHNPKANIGPIKGNFREVINWDHWGLNHAKEK